MKNSVKLFFLLLVFMPLKKGYSQMRFYNELGASGTLGISVSFFESFGYNFHPKNKLQHCISLGSSRVTFRVFSSVVSMGWYF